MQRIYLLFLYALDLKNLYKMDLFRLLLFFLFHPTATQDSSSALFVGSVRRVYETGLLGDFLPADAAVDKAVEDGAGAQTDGAVDAARGFAAPESVPDP